MPVHLMTSATSSLCALGKGREVPAVSNQNRGKHMQIKSLTWKLANWRQVQARKSKAMLPKAGREWGLGRELCTDGRAGQTAAFFSGSPDQSRGTALLSTHFYLPTFNLEQSKLYKQSISPSFRSKPMVFCGLPKHCKPLQSWALQALSLAHNIWSPVPPRNHLLSFPSHRFSSSPILPLTISTRSYFPCVSWKLCCQGSEGEPLASILQCPALLPAFFIKHRLCKSPAALGEWWAFVVLHTSLVLVHKRPSRKNGLKAVFYLLAAN